MSYRIGRAFGMTRTRVFESSARKSGKGVDGEGETDVSENDSTRQWAVRKMEEGVVRRLRFSVGAWRWKSCDQDASHRSGLHDVIQAWPDHAAAWSVQAATKRMTARPHLLCMQETTT